MSESMAFVGGVAVAGLAALLLLKGATNTPVQPNFTVSPPMQAPVVTPIVPQMGAYPYTQPNPNVPFPVDPNTSQKLAELGKFKDLSERLQQENTQLKAQTQQMQFQMQQMQLTAQNSNQRASAPAEINGAENSIFSSPIIWAVGGMSLAIGGGIVVAGVLALVSPKERNTRTVQVLHPYPSPNQHLAPVRRAEFLPPRKEVRRVQTHHEYDDIH
jgi:hypothetical protein